MSTWVLGTVRVRNHFIFFLSLNKTNKINKVYDIDSLDLTGTPAMTPVWGKIVIRGFRDLGAGSVYPFKAARTNSA